MVENRAPRWMSTALTLAGLYNLGWFLFTVVAPFAVFDALELPRPNYPEHWQGLGMLVGVFGVGYLLAARNPYRYWPIVFIGLLSKVLSPLGFLAGAMRGEMPWNFGLLLIPNDLIWWAPFYLILKGAQADERQSMDGRPTPPPEQALRDAKTSTGQSLRELSDQGPVLLVFLRHFG